MKEAWESVFTSIAVFFYVQCAVRSLVNYFIRMYLEWFRGLISHHDDHPFLFLEVMFGEGKGNLPLGRGGGVEF